MAIFAEQVETVPSPVTPLVLDLDQENRRLFSYEGAGSVLGIRTLLDRSLRL